ncbi:MAG: hypothetical protein AAF939_06555 [Planctomycetota bacterium]
MFEDVTRWGYCSECQKNVPFHRPGTNLPALTPLIDAIMHRIAIKMMDSHRLGFWHCADCRKRSFFLRYPKKRATNFQPHEQIEVTRRRPMRLDLSTRLAKPFKESDFDSYDPDRTIIDAEMRDHFQPGTIKEMDLELPVVDVKTILETTFEGKDLNPITVEKGQIVHWAKGKAYLNIEDIPELEIISTNPEIRAEVDSTIQAGNFRFDEEYRDLVVDELLFCHSTIDDLDLEDDDITQVELLAWISDRLNRLQGKVTSLEHQLSNNIIKAGKESKFQVPLSQLADTSALISMVTGQGKEI